MRHALFNAIDSNAYCLDNRALSPIKATTNKFDPSDRHLDGLLKHNREWAKAVKKQEPDFFEQINLKQEPKILWIGMDFFLCC